MGRLMPPEKPASMGYNCRPFLRWAGGKRWLARRVAGSFELPERRYYEPFLGSGAIFFRFRPAKATLSDSNRVLIDSYKGIRDSVEDVISGLCELKNTQKNFLRIRESTPSDLVGRAVRLIYLNRTAWNGLYRVNSQGGFNVPFGHYTYRDLVTPEILRGASQALQGVELRACDFADTIRLASKGDLIYADPPYASNGGSSGFLLYNVDRFRWPEQVRLSRELEKAFRRGASFLLSNRNDANVRALYAAFRARRLGRHSVIAGDPSHRKRVSELLVIGRHPGTD
jgi:DNA adenine methylase